MPTVNGFPCFADIVFRVGVPAGPGLQFVGVTSINYDDDMKRAMVYGTQRAPLGVTAGKYEAHGDVTFLLNPAQLMMQALQVFGALLGGFRFVPVRVSCAWQPTGPVAMVLDSFTCYVGKQEAKNKVGDEASERTFGLYIPGVISWNGIPGVVDLNSIGAVG